MDIPLMVATGFGLKFNDQLQNTRAFPVTAQWQDGKIVTVFPLEAAKAAASWFRWRASDQRCTRPGEARSVAAAAGEPR